MNTEQTSSNWAVGLQTYGKIKLFQGGFRRCNESKYCAERCFFQVFIRICEKKRCKEFSGALRSTILLSDYNTLEID